MFDYTTQIAYILRTKGTTKKTKTTFSNLMVRTDSSIATCRVNNMAREIQREGTARKPQSMAHSPGRVKFHVAH